LVDFAKPSSGKGIDIKEIEISADEEEIFIDLHPLTNNLEHTYKLISVNIFK
jgi:chloride channel 7